MGMAAMPDMPGMEKPELQALPLIRDRLSFLYLEHCLMNRQDGAITVMDARGTVHVPAATLGVLMLGPGTNVSHRAMELIGDAGASVIWVGEHGVRYYAHGRALTHSAHLLIRQAELVSNVRSRVAVARRMYQLRFPNEDVFLLTMQQMRGREGSRIRSIYRHASQETGVPWAGREYSPDNYSGGDAVNRALSSAHACLYGVVHSVIVSLGCSPGLGFVHTGHERSFVYDVADLYKADITIPIAFQIAAEQPEDVGSATRRRVRDAIANGHILEQAVKDIRWLLLGDETAAQEIETDVLYLWDDKKGTVSNAVNYGKNIDMLEEGELRDGYGRILEETT
jgi:CRISPR-associated protein Cas1